MDNVLLALRQIVKLAVLITCMSSSSSAWAQHVQLNSVAFAKFYLRLDGSGINAFLPSGGGTVNAQYGALEWEEFCIRVFPDDTIGFESIAFPGTFLRLDGSGVGRSRPSGGVANAQWGAFAWEHFKPHQGPSGVFAYESAYFPGVYMQFDGTSSALTFAPSGTGTVNAAYGPNAWTEWDVRVISPSCPIK